MIIQPPFGGCLRLLIAITIAPKNRPTSACANGAVHRHPKNRRRAVIYVSMGLACLPRDAMSAHCYRRRAVVYVSSGLDRLPRDTMSAHCYRRRAVVYVSSGLDRLPRDTVLLALQKQAKPGITAGLQYCSAITGRTVLLKEPIIWLP